MGMCIEVNPYPPDMGDLMGQFFRRGYVYVIVILGGYLPIVISNTDIGFIAHNRRGGFRPTMAMAPMKVA
jgi:hypothetical protein